MTDILLGISCFTIILVLFKLFDRYGVDNLQAIIVNYFTAGILGLVLSQQEFNFQDIIEAPWISSAFVVGFFFITVFTLLARSAQKVGMAISTVANKMSVILPVIAAMYLFNDQLTISKIAGILLALTGVILTSTNGKELSFDKKYLWLILFIFFGQGIADIVFNYAQFHFVGESEVDHFFAVLFCAAGLIGLFLLAVQKLKGQVKLEWKNLFWGILLGIPNYLTLLFFFRSLESGWMESSQVYPIYNIGVVVFSALTGFLLFKEKLSWSNWIGISVAIASIVLIGFG